MKKIQNILEQHLAAKLFPAPDAIASDAMRKLIFCARKQNLFESKVARLEYCICLQFDLPYITPEYTGFAEELVKHQLKNMGKAHRALIGASPKKLYQENSKAN